MLINTDTTDMDSQFSHVAQLAEMNLAVRLLWWHGYRLRDLGTRSEIFDVVGHTGSGLARVTVKCNLRVAAVCVAKGQP